MADDSGFRKRRAAPKAEERPLLPDDAEVHAVALQLALG